MREESGRDRVWVDENGVHCDDAGTPMDQEWGCGLAAFATRDDLRDHIRETHGDATLANADAAVAREFAARVPGTLRLQANTPGAGAPVTAPPPPAPLR